MEKLVTGFGVGKGWLVGNNWGEEYNYIRWLYDVCVEKASTGFYQEQNFQQRRKYR